MHRPHHSNSQRVKTSSSPNNIGNYSRGKRVWDQRMGEAVIQANYWKWGCFISLILSLCLVSVLAIKISQGSIQPYIVEVSDKGGVKNVQQLDKHYKIEDAQINHHLSEFISNFRGLSTDIIVVKQKWEKAFFYLTGEARTTVSEYAQKAGLINKVGKLAISVEVISSVRLTNSNTFQVQWLEKTFKNGGLIGEERYTASMHIKIIPPKNKRLLLQNPLGIYIRSIFWGKHRKESNIGG